MARLLTTLLLLCLAGPGQAHLVRLNTDISPPYQVQEDDRLAGTSVKALECIFDNMALEYDIRVLPWERAVQDVSQGRAEGFFSATQTSRGNAFATLSAPLALEKWYWYSNNEQRPAPSKGLRVGGVRGSNEVEWLQQHDYPVEPLVSSTAQLLHLLKRGRIDAFLADQNTLRIALMQLPLDLRPQHAYFQKYTTLGVYFSNNYLQRHPQFIGQFNQQVFNCLPEISILQDDERTQLQQLHDRLFSHWRQNPQVIAAVRTQNRRNAALSLARIHQLDQQWRNEQQQNQQPLIRSILDNPLSHWLHTRQDRHDGLISEILITDQHGLNVAMSTVSTDYWQGDEAKFAEPFFAPEGHPYMGLLHYDQSTQHYLIHVSSNILDPDSGAVIGVLIIGLDIEHALRMKNTQLTHGDNGADES